MRKMADNYIEKNEWYMTASKLKCFLKSPALYKLQYIDKVEVDKWEQRYFVIWNAFDTLVSYGEDAFLQAFYIDEWLVVKELKEKLVESWKYEDDDVKKMKLPELRWLYYGDDMKIRLTPAEWRDIMGMYREAKRQPLADFWTEYQTQLCIEWEYEWLKIRWTLDRFHLEKKLIRDWKTSWRIEQFEYNMDTAFDYVLSMAFYFVLAYVEYWEECDVILDVLWKKAPYPYLWYKLTKKDLLNKVENVIKPALEFYKWCVETNNRPHVNPITWEDVDRWTVLNDPYYYHLEQVMQDEFYSP